MKGSRQGIHLRACELWAMDYKAEVKEKAIDEKSNCAKEKLALWRWPPRARLPQKADRLALGKAQIPAGAKRQLEADRERPAQAGEPEMPGRQVDLGLQPESKWAVGKQRPLPGAGRESPPGPA